jgi:hypothetical protein
VALRVKSYSLGGVGNRRDRVLARAVDPIRSAVNAVSLALGVKYNEKDRKKGGN